METVGFRLAGGSLTQYGLTEPMEIRWKDRGVSLQAVVMPGTSDILPGALPLEGLDLCVDPVNQRLAGIHGDRRGYTWSNSIQTLPDAFIRSRRTGTKSSPVPTKPG